MSCEGSGSCRLHDSTAITAMASTTLRANSPLPASVRMARCTVRRSPDLRVWGSRIWTQEPSVARGWRSDMVWLLSVEGRVRSRSPSTPGPQYKGGREDPGRGVDQKEPGATAQVTDTLIGDWPP